MCLVIFAHLQRLALKYKVGVNVLPTIFVLAPTVAETERLNGTSCQPVRKARKRLTACKALSARLADRQNEVPINPLAVYKQMNNDS